MGCEALHSKRLDTIGLGNEIFYFASARYETGLVKFSRIAIQIDPIILCNGSLRLRNLTIPMFDINALVVLTLLRLTFEYTMRSFEVKMLQM